jgi:hypothetical protein
LNETKIVLNEASFDEHALIDVNEIAQLGG